MNFTRDANTLQSKGEAKTFPEGRLRDRANTASPQRGHSRGGGLGLQAGGGDSGGGKSEQNGLSFSS